MPDVAQRSGFVGRAPELALLERHLAAAGQGHGSAVLLAGEPGIGKTRLAEEFAHLAGGRGFRVYWGRCHEGAGAPPFWPWVQILRASPTGRDAADRGALLGSRAADLIHLLPDRSEPMPSPTPVPPEQARFRLFEAVVAFLRADGAAGPLVVILDDLHWADASSLLLLQFLARELQSLPLLLLGAYREAELDRQPLLTQTAAALARVEGTSHLSLSGLSATEVGDHLAELLGAVPAPPLIDEIADRTEGNPFFVGELARLLERAPAAGAATDPIAPERLPPGVRVVIDQRLAGLTPTCLDVLRAAAVLGRDVRLDALLRLEVHGTDAVLDALEEAEAARIVAPLAGPGGLYRFAHALIREALYAQLPAARRLRLHRRACEMLEQLYGPEPGLHLAELAHHSRVAAPAGEAAKATAYARRAAEQAMEQLAYEEAARQYRAALESLALLPAPDPRERAVLLLALGEAENAAGDTGVARATFTEAAAAARAIGATELLAGAALGFGGELVAAAGVDRRRVALLEEALAALGEARADALRVRLLIRLSEVLRAPRDLDRRRALSEMAVALARRLGDPRLLAAALGARLRARWGPDGMADLPADVGELRALADAADDPSLALQGQRWQVLDLLARGELAAADGAIERFARLAAEVRDPLARWQAALLRVIHPQMEGRFAEAEALAADALAIGERVNRARAAETFQHQVSSGRVMREGWAIILPGLTESVARMPGFPAWRASLALAYADSGRPEEARRELDRLAAADFTDLPHDPRWHYMLALLARTCALLGDRPRAALLYAQLAPLSGGAIFVPEGLIWQGAADHWLGVLAATLERWRDAERDFDAALALYARNAVPVWAARAQQAYGAMLLARGAPGDDARARALLAEALATANRLGMTTVAVLVRATRPRPAERAPSPYSPSPSPASLPHGLTPREVEVLRLLTAGRSNREIAETLVLSVRTVERHSANLYAKIGAHSKGEAVAYATRHGLA